MTVLDRIKVVLLDEGTISDGGLGRVAEYASEVIVVGERRRSSTAERLRALGVPVSVEDGKADIESAIRTAARASAIVVATGRPQKAEKLVRDAARGAADTVDDGLPAVGLVVLGEHETRTGKVFTVTDSGDTSGYEPLFALGIAEHLGREVVLVTPPGRVRGPRTNVFNHAQGLAADAGVSWTEVTDPSPSNFVITQSGSAVGVIIGVMEIPSRPGLLGSRPRLNEGDPRAAVSLINDAACDVMVIFDGLQLRRESMSKDQAAAVLGLGLVATGAAAAAATPASAMLGHVSRSITQQARTYRADIGDSGKGTKAGDAKDSDSKAGTSSPGGGSSHKTPKPKTSDSTAQTSTPSAAKGSKPNDSANGGTSTHKSSPTPASASKSDTGASTHKSPPTSVTATTVHGTTQSGSQAPQAGEPSTRTTPPVSAPADRGPAQTRSAVPPTATLNPAQLTTDADGMQVYHPRSNEGTPPPGWTAGTRTVTDNTGGTRTDIVWTKAPQQVQAPQQAPQAVPPQLSGQTTPVSPMRPTDTPLRPNQYFTPPLQGVIHEANTGSVQRNPSLTNPDGSLTQHAIDNGWTMKEHPLTAPHLEPTPQVAPHLAPPQTPQATQAPVPQQVQAPQQMATPAQVPGQVPTAVPGQVPQQVPNQVPGQVGQGTPTGGGGVPQAVQRGEPDWSLRAQTNTGSMTSEGLVPGDHESGTSASALSAEYNRGESSTETAPAAFGSETGAPPEGELAHTGADGVGVLAGIAASLVAAGSGLVIAGRRREKDDEESSDTVE